MVTLDLSEVEALERDISRAETLLQEHNVRTCKGTARLLFHQFSTEVSRYYRHLEVSQWQGFVRASMQRFLINNRSQLCPTTDSVQYNAEQLEVLRRLLPQLCDDFQTAARSAQHMTEQEQDTMALILAQEQKDREDSPQQPHNDGMDEVDSHDLSPYATDPASCHGRTLSWH